MCIHWPTYYPLLLLFDQEKRRREKIISNSHFFNTCNCKRDHGSSPNYGGKFLSTVYILNFQGSNDFFHINVFKIFGENENHKETYFKLWHSLSWTCDNRVVRLCFHRNRQKISNDLAYLRNSF